MAKVLDAETRWSYRDNPRVIGVIVAAACIIGIVLALALNSAGERTRVATNAPAPVTAPPLVPEPPPGAVVEPKV